MKRIKTMLLAVLFTASCGGSGGGGSVPANDEESLPTNLIGLWGLDGAMYLRLSAPFRAETWILDDLQNCFNVEADILTPLGGNNYRDSAGDVANLSVSSNGNFLTFRVGNQSALISRELGIDSSDLPVCRFKLDANATQKLDSGLLEHQLFWASLMPQ